MPEASILVTLRDQYSPGVQAMRSANSSFGKSLEETQQKAQAYQTRLSGLVKQQGELQVQLVDAKKALKEAESAYKATGEAADADALASAKEKYEALNAVMKETVQASKDTQNALRNLESQSSSLSRQSGSESGLLSALSQAGLLKMAGDAAGEWANTLVGSAFGSDAGSLFSSALTGAASGAALGSFLPGIGTAIGAAIGGGIGLASAGSQIYQQRDEGFKSYYSGIYDTQSQAVNENQMAGSSTAAQRELDAIAFNRLLGEGVGDQYLSDLRQTAADTPMEYKDLTSMSRSLATGFGDTPERMLSLITAIGDAGSAVGSDASGMTAMAQALSRMQSSGKATLEYLNIFQDRGVDVIGMLSDAMGKTQGQIYEMISDGDISGSKAVDIIQAGMQSMYGGAMETMAQTFDGLTSTLNDTMSDIYNAGGEGYNESRKDAVAQEIEAYGGSLGEALKEAYTAIGAGQAALENLGEAYTRDALSAVLEGSTLTQEWDQSTADQLAALSGEYQDAMAEYKAGNDAAGLKMDDIIATAEGLAQQQYEASELYRMNQEAETESLAALRENTAAVTAAANAYQTAQARTKGTVSSQIGSSGFNLFNQSDAERFNEEAFATQDAIWSKLNGYATGLGRVPYDNYPALLHEGERVLTAAEARSYNQGGAGSVQIVMNGTVIREDADIDRVAQALLEKLRQAKTAGVYR